MFDFISFLQSFWDKGLSEILALLFGIAIVYMVRSKLSHFLDQYEQIHKDIQTILTSLKDPTNPNRILTKFELMDEMIKIEVLFKELNKFILDHCQRGFCPFSSKVESIRDDVNMRLNQFETESREARKNTREVVDVIANDARSVSHALLDMVREHLKKNGGSKDDR